MGVECRALVAGKVAALEAAQAGVEAELRAILAQAAQDCEQWRADSELLIENLEVGTGPGQGAEFSQLMSRLEELSKLTVTLDTGRVAVARGGPGSPALLSPAWHRAATLVQESCLRWPGCLQPRGAALCPWSGQLWCCSAGSREVGHPPYTARHLSY